MTNSDAAPREASTGALHRAFWRWHFYAGLFVMPVLMLMALTGGLYLFKPEIEGMLYKRLLQVPAAAATTTPETWARAALDTVPGRLAQISPPDAPTASAKLVVEKSDGVEAAIYVNPHDATILGVIEDGGAMQLVKQLHSLEIAGPVFNLLIEVVAGWAIVMVATGIVLWWPRGQSGGLITVRGPVAKRVFWRDLHAVTGLFTGAIIVFLAATGMPWSAVWGKNVRAWTTEAGWGRPAAPASAGGSSHGPAHQPGDAPVPWALQDLDVRSAHAGHASALSLDDAIAKIDGSGLPRPYLLSIPKEAGKAWSASYLPGKVEQMRTVYLDGHDGRVIADVGYSRFGPAAKAIEWGIAVHQGQQFGLVNKLVMLAGCIAIWLLGISAVIMWWKRRPKGRLAAPPRQYEPGAYTALAVVVAPLAIIYPLVGGSIVAVLGLDLLFRRLAQPLIRP